MQRLLAILLVLIGLTGLALGRLGETTWAPATETTATVDLSEAGPAVVIDPGVLYVGGEQGQLVIEGGSDVSVITASNSDIEAYLAGVHHTRITGASDWTTLSTQEVEADGAQEITDPTVSDLWRSVETAPSPYTMEVADFWAAENGAATEQPYRALMIVTDGTAAGAEKISITWPVDDENEWVPFAYAGGAAIAVIGLVLLVVSLGGRRRDEDEELEDAPRAGAAAAVASPDEEPLEEGPVVEDELSGDLFPSATTTTSEADVWSLGSETDADPDADAEAAADADSAAAVPLDRTEQIDAVDDEEGQR